VTRPCLGGRLSGCGVVVDVRLLAVLLFLVSLAEIVAMGERVVVVGVGVPVGPMLPLVQWVA
jgi:hypothetical protein